MTIDHISIALAAGFLLDALIGDPAHFPHPIRYVGKLIDVLDKRLRKAEEAPERQLRKGILFTVLVLLITGAAGGGILYLFHWISPWAGLALDCVLASYMLAARSLRDASMDVCRPLEAGDTEAARRAVSMIVGRDTAVLDEEGIAKAAVESVAESTSDGVVAPLFYLAIGGPLAALLYKAANTMDSMVGYKNDKYLYFGRAAAHFDDLVNYIPARLSAVFMIAAAYLLRMNGRDAVRIFRRDRYNHASPNSAQTESVMAGALGLRLAGDAVYFGKTVKKPTIGDPKKRTEAGDIRRANFLMYTASALAALVFLLIRVLILLVLL